MRTQEHSEKVYVRLLELVPGMFVWTALLFPIIFSFSYPTWVAYFIIVFDLYWLFKAFYMSRNLLYSYNRMIVEQKTNWYEKLKKTQGIKALVKEIGENLKFRKSKVHNKLPLRFLFKLLPRYKDDIRETIFYSELYEEIKKVKQKDILNYKDIYHLVILATFKEDISILRDSISAIRDSNYPSKRILFVLAGEERDRERFLEYREKLKEEFGGNFGLFLSTIHPKDLPGEVRGKGGNITFAARVAKKIIDEKSIPYENIITTTLDADNKVDRQYFASLSFKYVINKDRIRKSYQPVPIFNNNIWNVPALVRVVAMSTGFWQLMESSRPERLRNFSSHAQSFAALIDTDFWSTETIVEDGHQYWRSFFTYDGDYEVLPVFLPIYQDAVEEETLFKTLKAQYIQLRRWAWGASDFPYVVLNSIRNKKIPLYKKIISLYRVIEGYFSWAVAPLFITVAAWLPGIINPEFKYTLVAFNLPMIVGWLLTAATFGIVINVMISVLLLPKRPKKYKKSKRFFMYAQWILLPITTIFFSSIPAIDAQTRLMIGKRLDWKVTKKGKRE